MANFFKELQEKKSKLVALANKACEFGWIEESRKNSIIEKLDSDILTIGVIGQMKCGKSTFLNSFVFENSILPAATTPMTSALSVITYGEKERVVAEFYSDNEWEEQKRQAARSLEDEGNIIEESKIKAAKELVSKSNKLGDSLPQYLGKTKEDSLENLIEYVGADGKYVSIVKSVKIYYPKDYLKGVEIVDTPGFNDPIVSREERTKKFLEKADIVLMMIYAGRPFDATDRDILFENVRQYGIGKVLVGINKYDIPYCCELNPEDENQIKDYVKSQIRKACRDYNDNTMVEILNEVEPIPLSAEMALLSVLPMTKINESEDYNFAWKRYCSNFGIGTQREMREWSHLDNLVSAVKEMVDNEKNKILFAKPLNAIIEAGNNTKYNIDKELNLINHKIELLLMSDSDVDEREENLSKANKRLTKKINILGDELDAEFKHLVRKGTNELEDIVDSTCNKMIQIVQNDWKKVKSIDSIMPRLEAEDQKLKTRALKRASERLAEEGKRKIKPVLLEFFNEVEDLIMRYLPEFDSRDFIKEIQSKIELEMENTDLFSYDSDEDDKSGLADLICKYFSIVPKILGVKKIENFIEHGDNVAKIEGQINSIANEFDPVPYLENSFHRKDEVIAFIKKATITDLIEPLQEQIQEISSKKNNKEKELKKFEYRRLELEAAKHKIAEQIEQIKQLKENIL